MTPLPADFNTIPVHGKWDNLNGSAAKGKVTFSASAVRLIDSATSTVIMGTAISSGLDNNGEILVNLPATDDPDITGTPFVYHVTVEISGSKAYNFDLEVPVNTAGRIELADLSSATIRGPRFGAAVLHGVGSLSASAFQNVSGSAVLTGRGVIVTYAETVWDPFVFGDNLDMTHWWDASQGVTIDPVTLKVSKWTSIVQPAVSFSSGSQAVALKQPTWPNQDEIRFNGDNINLVVPAQTRPYENRWFFLLFRVNWTAQAGSADSYLFSINGSTDQLGRQIPRLNYKQATHNIETDWYGTDGHFRVSVPVPGADDTWHTLVARRNEDAIYASIDGAPEVTLACYSRAFLPTGSSPTGTIGNAVASGSVTNWGIDTLIQGQGELTPTEIEKLHAWGLWRRGAEAQLPGDSAYLLAAPVESHGEIHIAEPDSYAQGYRFPDAGGWDDTIRGNALDLSDMHRTFHDHFTSLATITDGDVGTGPWYAPAHIDTSNAKFQLPSAVPTTFTLTDATTLQIHMQKVGGVGAAYSGHFQSADVWGNGFVQAVPPAGAVYYEARIALDNANGWPAFWLYSQSSYKDSAVSKCEIDILEAYGDNISSQNQLHITNHLHPAYRPQPGNIGGVGATGVNTRSPSKVVDVTQAPFNSPAALFNGSGNNAPGTFHTYGCRIDGAWITYYFDGKAVSRFPVFKEALEPLWMLISLQSQDGSVPWEETFMWIDYVDAYST